MAGEGVKLVERLRLGERPGQADWALASALLELRDAGAAYVAAAADLIEDRDKATKWLRFEVRVRLLALAAGRLEDAALIVTDRLSSYFEARAEDEGDEDVAAESPESSSDSADVAEETEMGVALEVGGIDAELAKDVGAVAERSRADSAWLVTSLADLVMSDPEEDAALDFCGEVEARFGSDNFAVSDDAALSGALDAAIAAAAAAR